ncbi:capsule assembly Wzi family protein [Antarcticibacterium arcticum]|uniref:Capsule assembly Wzi family protein n=1 Tax=Antarcticibacterium arcticum TaxID=2585771 RepID=A0A5B8YJI9_9FLAO|nr:capsule assembly Wzi family protein [Antarcticibacterium arcticum]QED36546.1 capsule assembly Wzi family protein [Antarcticibacterium arcticum]
MKFNIFTPLLFFVISSTFAQLNYSGNFSGKGIVYSGEESPFWIHSNQRGRVNETTNISALLSGIASYNITENARFSIGLGTLYQDGYIDKLQLDESYLGFENSWLAISLGRKQRQELYRGLSASNENILWSLNARPMPGLSFKTTRPVYFIKSAGLAFQASLEEFITDDERYVPDTRVHHKSFHLIFDKIPNIEFTVGVQHFVQWGGTSPVFGKLPGSFDDYKNVFMGKEGADDVEGQEVNVLGNHLGSYVGGIKTSVINYNVEILYNHIFEDGSGRSLANTPDGRYGIFISAPEQGKWIDAFMYEFYYTKNQSKNSPTTDGADNYFNNNLYRSGWTYENRILGVPFIFLDEDRFRVINNKMMAHHIGVSGLAFSKLPYKLLTSYRKNYGAKGGGQLRNNILSTYLDLNVYQNIFQVNLQVGADLISDDSPNFGAGIQLSKSLF